MRNKENPKIRLFKLCLIVICLLSTSFYSIAQSSTIRVTGRVEDEKGELMIGVRVVEVGSSPLNGVVTNIDGNYSITVSSSNSVLKFTYIGFNDYEIRIGSERIIDVKLVESSTVLDEVVAVAFGTQKKTDLVGSVTSIKPSELRVPASNLTTALAGQAAGIISFQRSGEPGQDNADFFIRGVTSFGTGKVDPLILIDGMELTVTELSRLRPDDIESFSIFKDATSTALYGARGANGVIYVITKQGVEGKPKISFRAEASGSAPTQNIKFADPVTYMRLYNEAQYARNPLSTPFYSTQQIDMTAEGKFPILYPAIDWKDMLFKDYAINHRYNLSVSGGGKVAKYFVSGSLSQDNGMLKVDKLNNFNSNVDLKSYTLRANVDISLAKGSTLIVRLNGNFDNYTGPILGGSGVYNQVVKSSPVDFIPYYEGGEGFEYVTHIMFGGRRDRPYTNPYAQMVKGYRTYDRSLMMAQLEFKQDLSFITNGLNFKTMINTNRTSRYDMLREYKPFFYEIIHSDPRTGEYLLDVINPTSGEEFLSFRDDENSRQQSSVFYVESLLTYNETFKERHNISGMLVGILNSRTNAKANDLQLSLPSRNAGLSGRLTYSYDERYYAEFNFGYNGSERFHESQRFGFFPSFGAAWTISNENFWNPLKQSVNLFKLRFTHGLVGNDQIGNPEDRFFYLSNVNMNAAGRTSTFGRDGTYRLSGIDVQRYANPYITWERSEKTNLGVEFGLFNKINILADFFKEYRSNILMIRRDIPVTMGLTAPVMANVGEASGKGVDVSLDYSHVFNKNLWLQARSTFTYATSKYEVYEEPSYEKEWWLSKVGYPISQQWGFIAERLFVDDAEVLNSPTQNFAGQAIIAGDIKYRDVNGDGQITDLDKVPIGYPFVPEINYGFGFSFGYKQFDISAFFQGSARSSFWIGGTVRGDGTGPINIQPFVDRKQVLEVIANDHYSLENRNIYAFFPRFSIENHANNMQLSTWWLRNGAFVRLKQVEIGYNMPSRVYEKLHMSSLRFYMSGSNLFLLSKFKLWDVEMGGNGLGYPLQRVINLGMNLTF